MCVFPWKVVEGCSQWAITFHNCLSFLNTRSTLTYTHWALRLSFPFGFCLWMVLHSAGFHLECRTQTSARSTSLHSQRVAQKSDILLANGILISSVILQLFLINLKMHPLALSFFFVFFYYLLSPLSFQLKCQFVMKDSERESVYLKACLCVCTHVYAKQKADHSRSESCSGWWVGQLPTTLKKMHLNIWKCSGMLWSTCETFHGKIAGDALHFHKCQRSLINVTENLLSLHYEPPLINNTNLETSALWRHLSGFRSLLKVTLFLLKPYFILNTFFGNSHKTCREYVVIILHSTNHKKIRYYILPIWKWRPFEDH